jgi:hypothetical protein
MCHNIEMLSDPGGAQQVQQHSIRKLGVVANCVPLQNLWCGLGDFALQVAKHTGGSSSSVV